MCFLRRVGNPGLVIACFLGLLGIAAINTSMYGDIDGGLPPLFSPAMPTSIPTPTSTSHPRYGIVFREGNKLFYLKDFKASTLG